MQREIAGLRVLVTGGARGIGAATARRLAAAGARLALVDLDGAGAETVAAELGQGALGLGADVRDLDALRAAAAATVARFGGIDVAIANAGVAYGSAVAQTPDDIDRVTVEVNLLGVMRTVRATLPHVLESRGQLVLVSSLASQVHMPLLAAYSASKAAVHAYGNSLRSELRPRGVAVTVAYFGFLDTEMGRLAGDSQTMSTMSHRMPGPLSRLWPVEIAVDAIVRAVERRSRRAVAPAAVTPAILLPALHQRVAELAIRRHIPRVLDAAAGDRLLRRGSTAGLVREEQPEAAPASTG